MGAVITHRSTNTFAITIILLQKPTVYYKLMLAVDAEFFNNFSRHVIGRQTKSVTLTREGFLPISHQL